MNHSSTCWSSRLLEKASMVASCQDTRTAYTRHSRPLAVVQNKSRSAALWCLVTLAVLTIHCVCAENFTTEATPSNVPPANTTTSPVYITTEPPRKSVLRKPECTREMFQTAEQASFVCGQHPDLLQAIVYAEYIGKKECEKNFNDTRWKCYGFSLFKSPNITNPSKPSKEAAVMRAFQSSVLAHTVAKACRTNTRSCSCANLSDDLLPLSNEDTTYIPQCSDHIEFGIEFAKLFLRKGYTGGVSKKVELELHNIKVGLHVLNEVAHDEASRPCKCIGVSGGCTFQHCYLTIDEYSTIAQKLRELYNNAVKVDITVHEDTFRPVDRPDDRLKEKEIAYLFDGEDFCHRDIANGVMGVSGQACSDPHLNLPDRCDTFCCGRQFKEVTITQTTSCNCRFVFCCDIQCLQCTETKTTYVCL